MPDTTDPAIACPKCDAAMRRVRVDDLSVDRCTGCGGLFLDLFEKERLLDEHRATLGQVDSGVGGESPASRAVMHCPRERARMIRLRDTAQSHVEIEMCQVCGGIFLDAGELTDLSKHTLTERIGRFFRSGR